MAYRLSSSKLKVYEDCERCFWFEAVKKVKRPSYPTASVTNTIDLTAKSIADDYRAGAQIYPQFAALGARFYDGPELKKWRGTRGLKWVDGENNELSGGIDDLLIVNDAFSVMDNKSRGSLPKEKKAREEKLGYYRRQLEIYHFLFDRLGYKVNDCGVVAVWHSAEKHVLHDGSPSMLLKPKDVVPIAIDISKVQPFFEGAVKVLKRKTVPKPSKDCTWCAWGKSTS